MNSGNRKPVQTGRSLGKIRNKRERNNELVGKIMEGNRKVQTQIGFFQMKDRPRSSKLTTENDIKIYPDEVIIRDIEVHQVYEVNVLVRNMTRQLKRIKIVQPTSSKFRCDYDLRKPLAPGLSMELVISFCSNRAEHYYDEVKIICDDNMYSIPLNAYPPTADLEFPSFINFGFLKLGESVSKKIKIENKGSNIGKIELKNDSTSLKIEPSGQIKLIPGEVIEVTLSYKSTDPGIFRGIVEVFVDGFTFLKAIDVNATVIEPIRLLIDKDGNDLSFIDFGQIFYGQKKKIEGFIINNSPSSFNYDIKLVPGLHKDYNEKEFLKTPFEVGSEQTQRVVEVSPQSGFLGAYSQIPIAFTYSQRATEDHKIWLRTNAFVIEEEKKDMFTNKRLNIGSLESNRYAGQNDVHLYKDNESLDRKSHEYTAVVNFGGDREPVFVLMTGGASSPMVKFRENNINFGECPVNDRRDYELDVYNSNKELSILLEGRVISNFTASPNKIVLGPGGVGTITMTFKPKHFGKFNSKFLFYINSEFDVPLMLMGVGKGESSKPKKIRGLIATDTDFYPSKNIIHDKNGARYGSRKLQRIQKLVDTTAGSSNLPMIAGNTQNIEALHIREINKKKYNNFLKDAREERIKAKKKDFKVQKKKFAGERIKSYVNGKEQGKIKENPAIDYELTIKDPKAPDLEPPVSEEHLYVNKPIKNYEPYVSDKPCMNFYPDPHTMIKQFQEISSSTTENRECSMELSGQQLQKIQVGPVKIDFASIFKKSQAVQYFHMRNELKTSIKAQLLIEQDELLGSYIKPQIIPSGKTASFEVSIYSAYEQHFIKPISYMINGKHLFQFMVEAEITNVRLRLEKFEEDFSFREDSLSMQTSRKIKIFNDGNNEAFFEWMESGPKSSYKISPMKGSVKKASYTEIEIFYTPSGNHRSEDEILTMNVVDGVSEKLHCKAILNEVMCKFLESVADFGVIQINDSNTQILSLKNSSQKNWAVFHIEESTIPKGMTIKKLRDKIPPEEVYRLEMTFSSNTAMKYEAHPIQVNLRGSSPLILSFIVETIFPNIAIHEDIFDFGDITFGNASTIEMTIQNHSPINTFLSLDLRENERNPDSDGFSKLAIKYIPERDDESLVLEERELEDLAKLGIINDHKEPSEAGVGDSEDEDIHAVQEEEGERSRYFTIKMKPQHTYRFLLTFSPKANKIYSFTLPLTLPGGVQTEGITRKVLCRGQTPKLIMDPVEGTLIFPKKIINSHDLSSPSVLSIVLTNMNKEERIPFHIDITELEEKGIFSVIPSQGMIEATAPVTIKVKFSPTSNQQYEAKLPLFLDDLKKPYSHIVLRGEGAYPRLLFDRREVIMPVVPLGVESICTFKIFNEGYQKMDISYNLTEDLGSVGLKVDLPDSTHLGINSDKIRVRVSFISKKAISFTTRMTFEDKNKEVYPIYISGTCDNCLLTNFPFFQTCTSDWEMVAKEGKPIMMQENTENESNDVQPILKRTNTVSVASHSMKSSIGFTPIPRDCLDRYCEHIKSWLNEFVLIVKIDKFPNDVIESNGSQVFELLSFLSKKPPSDAKAKLEPGMKKSEKLDALHLQYKKIIRFLKENGAMLNTIRPEYLLSIYDQNQYYKANPIEFATSNSNRITEKRYNYISKDSWSVLIYQILKVFYLCRISTKVLKQHKLNTPEIPLFPEGYLDSSQVYSPSEIVLIRWLEICLEKIYGQQKRIINFDRHLDDSLAIGATLQTYIGSDWKTLFKLKTKVVTEEDSRYNLAKLNESLAANGIMSMPSGKGASSREKMLFLIHLFQILPNYLPKGVLEFPVVLDSVCTRSIMLTNPSDKPIYYWANIESERDFTIEKNEIKLDPKETLAFQVKYSARISKPVKGRVTFRNKRRTGTQATALVFDLISNVTERVSLKRIKIKESVNLYEGCNIEVVVENPYPQQVTFTVVIENIKPIQDETESKKKKPKKPSQQNGKNKEKEVVAPRLFVPAFFCKSNIITIPKKATGKLVLYYLPISLETHRCNLIFTDENVGEMQYEVIGTPSLPNPFEKQPIKLETHLDSSEPGEFSVARRNYRFLNALKKLNERIGELSRFEEKQELLLTIKSLQDDCTYTVLCEEPFLKFPHTYNFMMKNDDQREDLQLDFHSQSIPGNLESVQGTSNPLRTVDLLNKMPVYFNYKFPVQNQKVVMIMQNYHLTDIRVYEFIVTVKPKQVSAQLEMITPARVPIVQNIPIINSLEQPAEIKVDLVRPENPLMLNAFKIPKLDNKGCFKVPKGHNNFELTFLPEWIGEARSKLFIQNKDTNENFEYELFGKGEEPLSEMEIVTELKVRTLKELEIPFENTRNEPIQYSVLVELPYAKGPDSFSLKTKEKKKYILELNPQVGGEFIGSITFTAPDGIYYWYMITMRVESTKSNRELTIESYTRKQVIKEVRIENTYKDEIHYKVKIDGPYLFGDNLFSVPANSTGTYKLVFHPMGIFSEKGIVTFANDLLGEIVYEVQLQSEEAPPIVLPLMREELGKVVSTKIDITNPVKSEIPVIVKVSNPQNFKVYPDKFTLPPSGSYEAEIFYVPSNLEAQETTLIIFETKQLGSWNYQANGIGLLPTESEPTYISGTLNQEITSTINFKNPFKDPISVYLSLEFERKEDEEAFELMLKKPKLIIPGLGNTEFPISFNPKEISKYKTKLIVSMTDRINWKFPIIAITESISDTVEFAFKVKCNKDRVQELVFSLPGVTTIDPEEEFKLKVKLDDEVINEVIQNWLRFDPIVDTINSANDQLIYKATFIPKKPFRSSGEIIIFKPKHGGRWRFKATFVSKMPDNYDEITLASQLNSTSKVKFRLALPQGAKGPQEFTAQFTHDSATEFVVTPASGYLDIEGKGETVFMVTYTPKEYGKVKIGKLEIQTSEFYWSYAVHGTFPKEKIPTPISQIDNKLAPSIAKRLKGSTKNKVYASGLKKSKS